MSQDRQPVFSIGNVVKLVSGGPDMAIRSVETSMSSGKFVGRYQAQWFAGKKLEVGVFPEESLELVKKTTAS